MRRRLYKPERKAARKAGIPLKGQVTEAAGTRNEVILALNAVAWQAGIIIGRLLAYDRNKDQFLVLAKDLETGKVSEATIEGELVAAAIATARVLNGGKLVKKAV